MHRRPIGRGRVLAAIAAAVLIVGCVLPWWSLGGVDLPTIGGNGFGGAGILVFVAALGVIALITLPYATDANVRIDRWTSYALLLGLAAVGYGLRLYDLVTSGNLEDGWLPDRSLGLWVTAAGLVLLGRAVYDIAREPNEPFR